MQDGTGRALSAMASDMDDQDGIEMNIPDDGEGDPEDGYGMELSIDDQETVKRQNKGYLGDPMSMEQNTLTMSRHSTATSMAVSLDSNQYKQ